MVVVEVVRLATVVPRRLLTVGKFIFVRTAALVSAFLLAGAVVARFGDAELGAYQISWQLFLFLALVLDAIAIAGQILVGKELGAGRPERAYDASVRMITLSVATGAVFAVGLLLLADALPLVLWRMTAVAAVLALAPPVWRACLKIPPRTLLAFAGIGALLALHWVTFYASIKLSNASVGNSSNERT